MKILSHGHHIICISGIYFVNHKGICQNHICRARIVRNFVTGSMRVSNNDCVIGFVEGEIIISTIPQHDIHFFFSLTKNSFIINTGINNHTVIKMRFIFFSLFNCTLMLVKIFISGKALYGLFCQITIRHGVAYCRDLKAHIL